MIKDLSMRIVLLIVMILSVCFPFAQTESPQQRISRYSLVIQQFPDSVGAFVGRCQAYNDQKQYRLAIGDCNKALKLDPLKKDALKYRGYALYHEKKIRFCHC